MSTKVTICLLISMLAAGCVRVDNPPDIIIDPTDPPEVPDEPVPAPQMGAWMDGDGRLLIYDATGFYLVGLVHNVEQEQDIQSVYGRGSFTNRDSNSFQVLVEGGRTDGLAFRRNGTAQTGVEFAFSARYDYQGVDGKPVPGPLVVNSRIESRIQQGDELEPVEGFGVDVAIADVFGAYQLNANMPYRIHIQDTGEVTQAQDSDCVVTGALSDFDADGNVLRFRSEATSCASAPQFDNQPQRIIGLLFAVFDDACPSQPDWQFNALTGLLLSEDSRPAFYPVSRSCRQLQ